MCIFFLNVDKERDRSASTANEFLLKSPHYRNCFTYPKVKRILQDTIVKLAVNLVFKIHTRLIMFLLYGSLFEGLETNAEQVI